MKMNWNEKLRPTTPVEIVGNNVFVKDFQEWERTGEYPSALLFVGPPGTGKTSAANALVHTMLDKWNNEMNVLWSNASDDRGIAHIREEIKQFSRLSGIGVTRKIVVLDEADGLTHQSQDALRGIMEKYAKKVLFILTANYPDKIKPAIKSRCTEYVFNRVTPKEGAKHLMRATELCGAPIEWEQSYEDVITSCDGDLRKAVNLLESIPKKPNALKHVSVGTDEDAWWDNFIACEYNELRLSLQDNLEKSGGRLPFMNKFHQYVRGFFDKDSETVFSVLTVWGSMMKQVYEWPGSDSVYVDVLVAKLKKEIKGE